MILAINNMYGNALADPTPGHTTEYYAGWKFGYGLGLAFDSDCGGVAVVK
jgi:hypothetical protein